MLYNISIDPSGLGGSAPAEGFIDPTSVELYRTRVAYTATATSPTVTAGDSFYIGTIPVIVAGTNLSAIVSAINLKTNYHHIIASINSNKLVLTAAPGYDRILPTMTDITSGITATIGFLNPVVSAAADYPSLANTLSKVRANVRWKLILESLQLTSNIDVKYIVSDATISAAATATNFVVDLPNGYHSYDFGGSIVYGETAVKYAVAKSLMFSVIKNVQYYDITDTDGTDATRLRGQTSALVTIGALTSVQQDALDAVTVTLVDVTP